MIVSQQQELAHQISSLVQMEGASLRDGVVIETMTVVITLMNVAAHTPLLLLPHPQPCLDTVAHTSTDATTVNVFTGGMCAMVSRTVQTTQMSGFVLQPLGLPISIAQHLILPGYATTGSLLAPMDVA